MLKAMMNFSFQLFSFQLLIWLLSAFSFFQVSSQWSVVLPLSPLSLQPSAFLYGLLLVLALTQEKVTLPLTRGGRPSFPHG